MFISPVSGRVTAVNTALESNPALVSARPYEEGWICAVEAENLTADLKQLTVGAASLSWYQDEVERFMAGPEVPQEGALTDQQWEKFSKDFLGVTSGA